MALPTSYLVTTKNLEGVINSVVNAQAPDRFTNKFLEDLGFKSSNDRLYISVFKSLGLLDENGAPTSLYLRFIDQTETKRVLAEAVQDAYSDLFALRKDAYNLDVNEIKGKVKTLTEGQKSDKVISSMASTFKALCDMADWSAIESPDVTSHKQMGDKSNTSDIAYALAHSEAHELSRNTNLHYNIQIHLPETTNMAVYDAIFQSLTKHLGI